MKNYQSIKSGNTKEARLNDTLIYQRYREAERMLLKSTGKSKEDENKNLLAKSSHNLGLAYHHREMLKQAEAAYKEALRNDPKNENTRYNLAVVQYLLKKQQNQQNQQQNQDQQQEQNQDQQQQQQQQSQDQQQEQNKDQQQQQAQDQQDKKENYERMLDALMQDEKELRDDMEKKAVKGIKMNLEKNW
jgi:tetratricopeptide (TPR) repeat protein